MPKNKNSTRKIYHPPYSRFMGFLKENGIKLQDIGELLGCTEQTVSDKNHGRADYKMSEINKLCDHYSHLGLNTSFFSTNKVTNTKLHCSA